MPIYQTCNILYKEKLILLLLQEELLSNYKFMAIQNTLSLVTSQIQNDIKENEKMVTIVSLHFFFFFFFVDWGNCMNFLYLTMVSQSHQNIQPTQEFL